MCCSCAAPGPIRLGPPGCADAPPGIWEPSGSVGAGMGIWWVGSCMWACVCSHDGCTRVCPLWAGCVCVELCVRGTVCCWQCRCVSAQLCVHTWGCAGRACVCHTCVCLCQCPLCLCVHSWGCVERTHVCHVCVCQCLLCLCVDGTRRAALPVSLCRVGARVLVRVAVLGCACALIPIPGGSVAPGCPWRSPPLAQCWPVVCLRSP